MTNGEFITAQFPNAKIKTISWGVIRVDDTEDNQYTMAFTPDFWNAEHKGKVNEVEHEEDSH